MIWKYQLTTPTVWLSFDFGEIVAGTRGEALEKATEQIKSDLIKANNALSSLGFIIGVDLTQIEVEIKK